MIIINFDKAKEITKQRLRIQRIPLLNQLDIDYMRAIETSQQTASIVEEKQRLRDITDLPDQCTTLDQLKEITI